MGIDVNELGFYVGPIVVSLDDVARAIAVHNGRGEDFEDKATRAALRDHAKDILDKAFRYAQARKAVTN